MSDRLALEERGADEYSSRDPVLGRPPFGGLLVAQGLRSATLTVPHGLTVRSVHAMFVKAGIGERPVGYRVERTRNGDSFSFRRVVAFQDDATLLVLSAAFHRTEAGIGYVAPPISVVPGPDGLPLGRYRSRWFDSRDVPAALSASPVPHARQAWFKPTAPLPADPDLHTQALAYLSDYGPTRAARHPDTKMLGGTQVSLDHSIWFHHPGDLNSWTFTEFVPLAASHGGGLVIGSMRDSGGRLLATVAQDVLVGGRDTDPH